MSSSPLFLFQSTGASLFRSWNFALFKVAPHLQVNSDRRPSEFSKTLFSKSEARCNKHCTTEWMPFESNRCEARWNRRGNFSLPGPWGMVPVGRGDVVDAVLTWSFNCSHPRYVLNSARRFEIKGTAATTFSILNRETSLRSVGGAGKVVYGGVDSKRKKRPERREN